MFSDHFYSYLIWSDHCFPFQIPHWLRMMYWVNTVNIYVNQHWKYFTFWAVDSLLGSTPGCWQQQGGEKKNQPASHHFFFCLFLLSLNDCGHHPIFWFFLPQLQNSSDFVTNRFLANNSMNFILKGCFNIFTNKFR